MELLSRLRLQIELRLESIHRRLPLRCPRTAAFKRRLCQWLLLLPTRMLNKCLVQSPQTPSLRISHRTEALQCIPPLRRITCITVVKCTQDLLLTNPSLPNNIMVHHQLRTQLHLRFLGLNTLLCLIKRNSTSLSLKHRGQCSMPQFSRVSYLTGLRILLVPISLTVNASNPILLLLHHNNPHNIQTVLQHPQPDQEISP